MKEFQHTIGGSQTVKGTGLHTGEAVNMVFKPAAENHGIIFQRIDLEGKPLVHADVDLVIDTSRGTTLSENGAQVHTVEHVMAAVAAMGVDNILIELDGPEPPIMDGSAHDFMQAIHAAGLEKQQAIREVFEIQEAVNYREADRNVELAALPDPTYSLSVLIDYNSDVMAPQQVALDDLKDFEEKFSRARTFCFLHELDELKKQDLIRGGSLDSAVVWVDKALKGDEAKALCERFDIPAQDFEPGLLKGQELRFHNEPARHKLLDLIGDLALIGVPIRGRIMAARPGHKANIELAKQLKAQLKRHRIKNRYAGGSNADGVVFDIDAIQRILPHRYPFLMVDRITEFSEETITGIKNVTVNEPFFQGHFPGNPIFPGVLQLEAMAQVGGVMLLNTVEDPSSMWVYFVAIDNARFKKPVRPGDTLVFKLKLLNLRRNICKMRGEAFVDDQIVCSADLVASLVPKSKS
ncbi:MAG: bifunctional UDP-3-O-[3-hydroxymyristoyl] N-acetylglucosamine deacetylase/3-hydroxyacyl-ACP dehydratase [Bacteroidia bacterium]